MVATSHDVMPDIELYQPADEATALDLASRLGNEGWLLGGGQDTYCLLYTSDAADIYSV